MSGPKEIYQFLKSRGLIRKLKEEYELEPENPAQSQERVNKNKQEFLNWKSGLPKEEQEKFNEMFGE